MKAAKGMSLAPDRCLVIEDTAAGIAAAKRAEMKAIGVTKTFALFLAKPPKTPFSAISRAYNSKIDPTDIGNISILWIAWSKIGQIFGEGKGASV